MPVNNNLKKKEFPFPIKFDKGGSTEFKNNLENIKIELVQAPRYEDIRESCIAFANATWKDKPMTVSDVSNAMQEKTKDKFMFHIFTNKILPTTMETIKLTFLISGICLQEVTHILRYRRAVFSAECSGDKFLNDKDFVVPTSIENSAEFHARYKKLCLEAKQLYMDMVDSKEISTQDARYIMPRSLETYYYMSISLKDALIFIYDRIDKQIQPQSDNIIAYGMMTEIVKQYPLFAAIFTEDYIHRPADFYIKTARQYRSTNWYSPDKDSDKFEYNEEDFVYGLRRRDFILGTNLIKIDKFTQLQQIVVATLNEAKRKLNEKYSDDFLRSDFTKEELSGFDSLL